MIFSQDKSRVDHYFMLRTVILTNYLITVLLLWSKHCSYIAIKSPHNPVACAARVITDTTQYEKARRAKDFANCASIRAISHFFLC